jgi:hypothetical protein
LQEITGYSLVKIGQGEKYEAAEGNKRVRMLIERKTQG